MGHVATATYWRSGVQARTIIYLSAQLQYRTHSLTCFSNERKAKHLKALDQLVAGASCFALFLHFTFNNDDTSYTA